MGNKKSKALQKDATLEVEREYEQIHLQKSDTALSASCMSEFDLMRTLGTGTFGRVRACRTSIFSGTHRVENSE